MMRRTKSKKTEKFLVCRGGTHGSEPNGMHFFALEIRSSTSLKPELHFRRYQLAVAMPCCLASGRATIYPRLRRRGRTDYGEQARGYKVMTIMPSVKQDRRTLRRSVPLLGIKSNIKGSSLRQSKLTPILGTPMGGPGWLAVDCPFAFMLT